MTEPLHDLDDDRAAAPAPKGQSPRVVVVRLGESGRWLTLCLTGSCRPTAVGEYPTERAAKAARANHARWHDDMRARGAECPTCAQVVPAQLRHAAGLPDLQVRHRARVPGEVRLW